MAQAVVISDSIKLEGLAGLNRAFKLVEASAQTELHLSLIAAATPVRTTATALAISEIPRLPLAERSLTWSQMRIGQTLREVYVAPVNRGTRILSRKRPKFASLMLERAMVPALDQNRAQIIAHIELMLQHLGKKWEQVPGDG